MIKNSARDVVGSGYSLGAEMNNDRRLLVTLGFCFWFGCATAGDGQGQPDADPDQQDNTNDAGPQTGQPDGGPGSQCNKQPCDLVPQCGCTGSDACDLDGTDLPNGKTQCRAVTTPGAEDANCNTLDDCAGGYVCLGSNGQCREYCQGDTDCSALGYCLLDVTYDSGGGNFMPVPGASTCTKACQPHMASNNGCPSTPQFGCRMFIDNPDGVDDNGDEYFLTDCTTAVQTGGQQDADCSANFGADCAAGFDCVGVGTESLCKQICVVGGANTCGGALTCNAFGDPQPIIGGVTYGFCN